MYNVHVHVMGKCAEEAGWDNDSQQGTIVLSDSRLSVRILLHVPAEFGYCSAGVCFQPSFTEKLTSLLFAVVPHGADRGGGACIFGGFPYKHRLCTNCSLSSVSGSFILGSTCKIHVYVTCWEFIDILRYMHMHSP